MKKILLVVLVLLLVGCGSVEKFEYEVVATELVVQTEAGERMVITDPEVIQSVYDVLASLELKTTDDLVMLVQIDLSGVPVIYLDDDVIEIDGENYLLPVITRGRIDQIIDAYSSKEVEVVIEDKEEEKEIPVTDLAGYTFLDSFNNGTKIYYKPIDGFYNRDRVSEIVAIEDNKLSVVYNGILSVPVMNEVNSNIAFVSDVGFEMKGTLYVYDGSLKEVTSDELVEKTLDSRTIKDAEWYDEDTLFIIFGFDSGTVSQGGDVYFINVQDGDMRMVIDAKAKKEIVNVEYSDDVLKFEVLTWTDNTYQNYVYNMEEIIFSEHLNLLPIRVEVDPVTEE